MWPNEDFQNVLNKAYFFLKFRLRTRKELSDYLLKKIEKTHISSEVVKEVLTYLEELNLVNDRNFVSWFVEQRTAHKPGSEYALKRELQRFGVEKDIINEYFFQNPTNQSQQATQALVSRWHRYVGLDKRKRFEKAAAFLGRRGFSFDIIKKTIAEMEKEE